MKFKIMKQNNLPVQVCELIDNSTRTWDAQLLNQFFTPMDREIIGNLPLSTDGREDFFFR